MDYHHHARLTVFSREQLAKKVLLEGFALQQAAACFNLSERTAAKWGRRYGEQGVAGLRNRSSRPHRLRQPATPELQDRVAALRRQRWTGLRIAQQTGLSRATVSRILRRWTGNRRDSVDGAGWEYVHVAIDDHSRIAFSAICPDQTRAAVLGFLKVALAYSARFGIRCKALLTDNGSAYRFYAFAAACKALGLKHRFTRPYTPRTNGKAERFIQAARRERGLRPLLQQLQRTQPGALRP